MHMGKKHSLKLHLTESKEGIINQERNLEAMCYFSGSNSAVVKKAFGELLAKE